MDCWDVETEESRETVLADGDSRLEFLWGRPAVAGESDLPLPRTLPPPSLLDDMFSDLYGSPVPGLTTMPQ